MAKSKKPRKKYHPRTREVDPSESPGYFNFGQGNSTILSIRILYHLQNFEKEEGTMTCWYHGLPSDYQSLKIRLKVGEHLLENFECFDESHHIEDALEALQQYVRLDYVTAEGKRRKTYTYEEKDMNVIIKGIHLVQDLIDQSTFEEEIIAYKKAEDDTNTFFQQYEYIFHYNEGANACS